MLEVYCPNPAYFGHKNCVLQGKRELVLCTTFEVDSTVLEINRGSHNFWGQFLWSLPEQPVPAKFGNKDVFGNLLPKPKLCTKFEVARFKDHKNK